MLHRIRREVRENPVLVEGFFVFLAIAGVLIAAEFAIFAYQDRLAAAGVTFFSPRTFLDDHMPFVPELVWPYWAYFGILGSLVWLPKNRHQLARAAFGLLFVHLAGDLIFVLFPSAMTRVPIPCDSLSCNMVGAMYMLDPGYAIFPSLHVAASVYVTYAFFVYRHPARWLIAAFAASILAATVLIRQHYVIDVPAGVLLGLSCGPTSFLIVDWFAERRSQRILRQIDAGASTPAPR